MLEMRLVVIIIWTIILAGLYIFYDELLKEKKNTSDQNRIEGDYSKDLKSDE